MTTQAQNIHTLETIQSLETFCNELDAYLRDQSPKAPKAQDFGPQNHAAFNGNPLRQSYRHHNPLVLTADQVADLAVLVAWNSIADEMAQALPVPSMHTSPLSLLTDEVDGLSLIETQIDLFQGRAVSPSAKSNLVDAWLEGRASWGEVKAAHQPKQTYTQRLVKRAYAVLTFVGGYARVR